MLQLSIVVTMLLLLLSSPLTAQDIDQPGETAIKEQWGQLLLCQRIYKMSEVRPRLYDFDTEQCAKAGQLITGMVSKYTPQEQQALKSGAEKHAAALSFNTPEPYHSVPACREYCGELAERYDQQNE